MIWPDGTETFKFENLDGLVLVSARLRGAEGRDTTGLLIVDTGAGYLGLDHGLTFLLGLVDTLIDAGSLELIERPLAKLEIARTEIDQESPILSLDLRMPREVTDRPVLGLLGRRPIGSRVLYLDYRTGCGVFVARPSHPGVFRTSDPTVTLLTSRSLYSKFFTRRAVAVPFRLAGDGKILVEARIGGSGRIPASPWLTWIVDTGATKCVLFEDPLGNTGELAELAEKWPAVRGLEAPTLLGSSSARIAMVPSIQVRAAAAGRPPQDIDVAILASELSGVLSRTVGEPVHGLIGYSYLKRFRIAIDYPNRVLWLDPRTDGWNDRPYEYVHVGIQIERREGELEVVAVAEGSPAAVAGIEPGDRVISIDERPARDLDVVTASRLLEGAPGSTVTVGTRRGTTEKQHRLVRRRLL